MKTTKGRRRLKQSRSSSRFGLPLDRVTVGRDQDERVIAGPWVASRLLPGLLAPILDRQSRSQARRDDLSRRRSEVAFITPGPRSDLIIDEWR
jgi:hypothetical protein